MKCSLGRTFGLILLPSVLSGLLPGQALASNDTKSVSTPKRSALVISAADLKHRVCYYQDQAYSFGALLEVGSYIMRCDEANNFESNGALKWVTIAPATIKSPVSK